MKKPGKSNEKPKEKLRTINEKLMNTYGKIKKNQRKTGKN